MRKPASLVAIALALAFGPAGCAPELGIPTALEPYDSELAWVRQADGAQVYECHARKVHDGSVLEWASLGPEATLYDEDGHMVGIHGGQGPYWEANDGSRITGEIVASVAAPQGDAVAWQLAATRSDGPWGTFSGITSVQRVNTYGGLLPSTPCTPSMIGRRVAVHYTADYRFFVAKR